MKIIPTIIKNTLVLITIMVISGVLANKLLKVKYLSKQVDIYYSKSLSGDFLCWNKKCYQSLDSTPTSDLIKHYQKNIKEINPPFFNFKTKLLSFPEEFHNSENPVLSFVSTPKYLFLVVNKADDLSSRPGGGTLNRSKNVLYVYDKNHRNIKPIFILENSFWISRISPDQKNILLTTHEYNPISYLVNIDNMAISHLGSIKQFSWESANQYQISYGDVCPNNKDIVVKCTIENNRTGQCDTSFNKLRSYYKIFANGNPSSHAFADDTPDGWSIENIEPIGLFYYQNIDNSLNMFKISGRVSCLGNSDTETKNNKKSIKIDGFVAELNTIYNSQPRDIYAPFDAKYTEYVIAIAEFEYQNHKHYWTLSYYGDPQSIVNRARWTQALKDFSKYLSTIKISYKESL